MEDQKRYHLIDNYLSGDLQGTELDKFKIALKNSKALRQQVALQSAVIDEISKHREAELRAIISKENSSSIKTISVKSNIRTVLSMAASIALFLLTYIYFVQEQPTKNNKSLTEKQPTEVKSSTTLKKKKVTAKEPPLLATNKIPAPEMEMTVEEYSDFDNLLEKELLPTENNAERDETKEIITAKSEEFVVERDELLASKIFSLQSLDNIVNNTYDETGLKENSLKATTSKAVNKTEITLEDASVLKKDKQHTPSEEIKIPQTKKLDVEYWKSVVNFKGYIYDGNKVQLYGIPQNKLLIFKELDNRIYLKMDSKYYFIEKNKTYKRLSEVSNPTLLNILND
jgi:hypothetical protein